MSEHIKKYINDVNKINEEIKAIKSADCIMDYDAKTEIIKQKMKAIEQIDMMIKTTVVAESMKDNLSVLGFNIGLDNSVSKDSIELK